METSEIIQASATVFCAFCFVITIKLLTGE